MSNILSGGLIGFSAAYAIHAALNPAQLAILCACAVAILIWNWRKKCEASSH